MKKIVLYFAIISLSIDAHAQSDSTTNPQVSVKHDEVAIAEPGDISVYTYVSQMPEFPGGKAALNSYLIANLKYPEEALEEEKEAKVYVAFVVDQNGDIKNVSSIRPVGYGFDDEAIRVVKAMPKWKPGKQNGREVKVHYQVPIVFSMAKDEDEPQEKKVIKKTANKKEPKEKEAKEIKPKVKETKKVKEKKEKESDVEEKE